MTRTRGALLSELARDAELEVHGGDPFVTGVTDDSRRVQRGDIFVAYAGHKTDGSRFIADAMAAGAVAICAAKPIDGIPTVVSDAPRRDLARLAATVYGRPAKEVRLIGITGSLGKTSTALLAEACLAASHQRIGVIGSLGVRARGRQLDSFMTTPGAPVIHQALRWMVDEGVDSVVMEVTSHGILLDRVTGLEFELGVFTNLVPDEHLEFHPTPEHYIETKARFLDMLTPDAPLVFNADDALVVEAARQARGPAVGVSIAGNDAAVMVSAVRAHFGGSDFDLMIRDPLPRLNTSALPPCTLKLRLPLLGNEQVGNAALAATAALVSGVEPGDVERGLASTAPIRRRMEILHPRNPLVVDDTVGHPRSIAQVQALAVALECEYVRIAYAIRGTRGATINARNAEAIADLTAASGAELVVTSSEDVADERNRVTEAERDAVRSVLERRGVEHVYEPQLAATVKRVLKPGADLVLLLGAQGMDQGARMARSIIIS